MKNERGKVRGGVAIVGRSWGGESGVQVALTKCAFGGGQNEPRAGLHTGFSDLADLSCIQNMPTFTITIDTVNPCQ